MNKSKKVTMSEQAVMKVLNDYQNTFIVGKGTYYHIDDIVKAFSKWQANEGQAVFLKEGERLSTPVNNNQSE